MIIACLFGKTSFKRCHMLHSISARNFARKIKETVKLAEKKEIPLKETIKPVNIEDQDMHDPSKRTDPKSDEVDDEFISQCMLGIQHLPPQFLKRAKQVFSKLPHTELRNMAQTYNKLYQVLHATEKPTDLTKVKPFANTDELAKDEPRLIYLGKKKSAEEEEEIEKKKVDRKEIEKRKEEVMEKKAEQTSDFSLHKRKSDQETDFGIEYDRDMALAYMVKKMPHTFGVACRIFSEIRYRLPDFEPQTFLDFGAGLGSGSWAFKDIYQKYKKIAAVEPSTAMRKLGKHMTQDVENLIWLESLAQVINISSVDLFDFVYCGYVLEEANNAESREMIIQALWQKIAPGGVMVLVEPGSPKGFRFIHDFREWIRKKPRDEVSIIGPCPHQEACPQAEPHYMWCNFEQRIAHYPTSVFAKHPKQGPFVLEKFSYLIVKKGKIIGSEEEAKTPAERSFFWDRLIRPTRRRTGHIIIDLCSRSGKLDRLVVARSHGVEGGYKFAKKVKWGDLWSFKPRIPNKFRKEAKTGKKLF